MQFMNVSESLVVQIREEIITGQLPPGSKLNEIDLSERFGVSRPPLREAFRKLEYEKIIRRLPRKGVHVAEMSEEDCRDVYQTRLALECAAIDRLRDRKLRCLPEVRNALEQGENYPIPDPLPLSDVMPYYSVMARFHESLVEACGSLWLSHFYQGLRSNMARYQAMYLIRSGTYAPSMEVHRKTLRLCETWQFDEAKEMLRSHILHACRVLIQEIRHF